MPQDRRFVIEVTIIEEKIYVVIDKKTQEIVFKSKDLEEAVRQTKKLQADCGKN